MSLIELESTLNGFSNTNDLSEQQKIQLRKARFQKNSLSIDTTKVNILG